MPVEFTKVYTTPLQFFNLFTSTNVNQNISNRENKLKLKAFDLDPRCFVYKWYQKVTAFVFTQHRVALRFRSTTFRKRGRVATAKVTFSNKSAPVLCKRNAVFFAPFSDRSGVV